MKFLASKDGKLRATIRVPFRVGRDELIEVVCHSLAHTMTYEVKEDKLVIEDKTQFRSRTSIVKLVEKTYRSYGADSLWPWAEDCSQTAATLIRTFATETIDKLFPEIKPA